MKVSITLKDEFIGKRKKIREIIKKLEKYVESIDFVGEFSGGIYCDINPKMFNLIKKLPFVEVIDDISNLEENKEDDFDYFIENYNGYFLRPFMAFYLYKEEKYIGKLLNYGKGIKIGILDGGIVDDNLVKPVKERIIIRKDINDENDMKLKHGTMIANIISGSDFDDGEKCGILPNIDLYDIIIAKDGLTRFDFLIRGIEEGIKKGIRIFNYSFSSNQKYPESIEKQLYNLYKNDIILCCCVGNDGKYTPNYPAAYTSFTFSCGSCYYTNEYNIKSDFSNEGFDFFHFGGNDKPNCRIITRDKYGREIHVNGTSLSTPLIACVIALMLKQNPNLSNDQIKRYLIKYSSNKGQYKYTSGYGRPYIDYIYNALIE